MFHEMVGYQTETLGIGNNNDGFVDSSRQFWVCVESVISFLSLTLLPASKPPPDIWLLSILMLLLLGEIKFGSDFVNMLRSI